MAYQAAIWSLNTVGGGILTFPDTLTTQGLSLYVFEHSAGAVPRAEAPLRPALFVLRSCAVLYTAHNRSIRRRPRLHGAHFPVHLHAAPSEPYTIQRHRGDGSRTGINTAAPARPDRTAYARMSTRHKTCYRKLPGMDPALTRTM